MSFSYPMTVTILGIEFPFKYVAGAVGLLVILCCGCCCFRCCRKKTKIVASEKFRWPNSASFLRKTDPGHPPKLVVNKYDAEMRTDRLPEERESFWIAKYQPNGEREEVKNQMYLRWKDGVVFGVGFEKVRRLCKISGKYNYNMTSNQTVLAMECKFSNELDTVLFHGWGNGTSFMGNCYMHEIDRFALTANLPGIRQAAACKFKGSFIFQKMASMGDPSLRVRLHTRRVHKWAGPLFPDETVTPPTSPLHSPGERGVPGSRTGASRKRVRKALGKLNPFSRRRKGHFELDVSTPTRSAAEDEPEYPPWVQKGADNYDEEEEDPYGGTLNRGRLPVSPGRPVARRPSQLPIDNMNYLEIDGVPGRNGPAMV